MNNKKIKNTFDIKIPHWIEKQIFLINIIF